MRFGLKIARLQHFSEIFKFCFWGKVYFKISIKAFQAKMNIEMYSCQLVKIFLLNRVLLYSLSLNAADTVLAAGRSTLENTGNTYGCCQML